MLKVSLGMSGILFFSVTPNQSDAGQAGSKHAGTPAILGASNIDINVKVPDEQS